VNEAGRQAKLLLVDDTPQNIRVLEAVLAPRGYELVSAASGEEALERVAHDRPDLVLLDVMMPGIDGYEVCRRIRADPESSFLPVIIVTSLDGSEKKAGVEAGADDFITKPFNQAELLARVRSLLRVKEYHDTIERQAADLRELNEGLELRVREQVAELEQLGRLRRFLSPQIAEVVVSADDDRMLESHRREVAVLFCDLRGYTAFAESVEPEELMRVLRQFHVGIGELVRRFEATVGFLAGDGLEVFFNDPIECDDPAERAVRMGLAIRELMTELTPEWHRRGYDLGFGVGIALGYATLGQIGFDGRFDYAALGSVTILAARLCDAAGNGQVLVSRRAFAEVEDAIEVEQLPDLALKGFANPVPAVNAVRVRSG
jgi:adenylate cyclase